ncbi:MAG: four helix bundle protein [Patescibacteria group bacterium]
MEHRTSFHEKLKRKMDEYVHFVYAITRKFLREEIYGVTSQLRRAALIEGYALMRSKVYKNFLETSYGSLKESKCLLHFSLVEKYLSEADYKKAVALVDEIGAMLWGTIKGVKS